MSAGPAPAPPVPCPKQVVAKVAAGDLAGARHDSRRAELWADIALCMALAWVGVAVVIAILEELPI